MARSSGRLPTFYETLTAAIADMIENGYDSVERLDRWTRALREAMARTMTPDHVLEGELKKHLGVVYTRMVEKEGLLVRHPGVGRFTIQKVKPKLHAELERRKAASFGLIRNNKAQAVLDMERRFSGWGTSIPAGGTDAKVDRVEEKTRIRKSLVQLPFEERRVLIDQAHKFVGNLNDIVATDGGAIAAQWHSHYRQPGYDYREDHKERDSLFYLIRGSWAQDAGLVKPNDDGYVDQHEIPGQAVFCFPGDSLITWADSVEIAYRRWFDGDLVGFTTASGRNIRSTPNHPVMTPNGWVAIGLLKKGDHVLEVSDNVVGGSGKHPDNTVTTIMEAFETAVKAGVSEVSSGKNEQFHGDGSKNDVDIVTVAGKLSFGLVTPSFKGFENLLFSDTDNFMPSGGPSDILDVAGFDTLTGGVRGCNKVSTSFDAFAKHPDVAGRASVSLRETGFRHTEIDGSSCNSVSGRDREDTLSGFVGFDSFSDVENNALKVRHGDSFTGLLGGADVTGQGGYRHAHDGGDLPYTETVTSQFVEVVEVERKSFSGHVYNLQTGPGYYTINGVLVHNCRCWFSYVYAIRRLPVDMLTVKGRMALADRKRAA